MKNILLAGYYGFGNLGDEAILEMFLKQISEITDKKNITVLSGNPEETYKKYNVNTIDRYNVLLIIKKLRTSHALVIGGGSLLQDVTSKRSIYYYLFIIRLAKLMGKKVMMLSQGIGPINSPKNRKMTAKVLNKVDAITVRDVGSKEFLEEIGVNKNKVMLSVDPVINFKTDKPKALADRQTKNICFSLRKWKNTDTNDEICKVVERLYEDNIKCYFIPFYYNEDLNIIKDLELKLGDKAVFVKERLSTEKAYSLIEDMNLLIGVRLHALIFASSANVPFIGISYDPKIDQFVESLNMRCLCNIRDLNSDILYDDIIYKLNNEASEKDKLEQNVNKLREIVNVNNKLLEEI